VSTMPYTEVDEGIVVCNDCGAHASTSDGVVHHETCRRGESRKWERFYAKELGK